MYDSILVPTDGSDQSIRAAEHGDALAQLFDATVHLVSVVDVQAAAGLFDAGGVDDRFVGRLEATGREAIEAVEAVVDEGRVEATTLVRGDPGEAILEYAADHDIDLLTMGTHGRSGVRRFFLGSVTEHVLRKANVPVLTVRATDHGRIPDEYDEVLIPTDGSEASGAAVEHGLAVARQAGARVHAVHVVDIDAIALSPSSPLATDIRERLEADGESSTERIVSRARSAGLDAVAEVREGFPAGDLLAYADEQAIDLIAMGTAGRRGLSRVILGSTTERVVRRADAPVLAINTNAE